MLAEVGKAWRAVRRAVHLKARLQRRAHGVLLRLGLDWYHPAVRCALKQFEREVQLAAIHLLVLLCADRVSRPARALPPRARALGREQSGCRREWSEQPALSVPMVESRLWTST